MERVISKFLRDINIPISKTYFEEIIASHPDYPSMLSVVDTLERFGIGYNLIRIEKDQLNEVEFPYLLPISDLPGKILPVKTEKELAENKKFLSYWKGLVLLIERGASVTDPENQKERVRERSNNVFSWLLGIVVSTCLVAPVIQLLSWFTIVFFATAVGGIVIGYLLITKDLGIASAAVDAFCKSGKNMNCDAILNSNAATVFGAFKLSDVVATYFIFQSVSMWLAAAFPILQSSFLLILSIVSMLSLPVVIFSVSYQYFVAKVWCKLCLLVNAVLLVQAGLVGYAFTNKQVAFIAPSVFSVVVVGLLLVGIASSVFLLKDIAGCLIRLRKTGFKSNRVKYSVPVFTEILSRQQRINESPFEYELLAGDSAAPVNIIVATNLYCHPCKEKHELVNRLLSVYPEKVSIATRFIRSGKDTGRHPTSSQYIIEYWFQNIRGKKGESHETTALLHDWFAMMDLEKFRKKYPVNVDWDNAHSKQIEARHFEWVQEAGVQVTPAFFINGYKLPADYSIEELMFLIPGLAESIIESESNVSFDQFRHA